MGDEAPTPAASQTHGVTGSLNAVIGCPLMKYCLCWRGSQRRGHGESRRRGGGAQCTARGVGAYGAEHCSYDSFKLFDKAEPKARALNLDMARATQ